MDKDFRLTVNISGVKFQIRRDLLTKKPESYLGQLAINKQLLVTNSKEDEIYIDRPVGCFEAILAFYQTNELHMPTNVCPRAFKKELDFWGFHYEDFEQCCRFKYLQFVDDQNKKATFVKLQTKLIKDNNTKPGPVRSKIWRVIDNREQSLAAKIFLIVGIIFVLASVISISITTLPEHRRSLTACEIQNYYRKEYKGNDEAVLGFLSYDCNDIYIYEDHIEIEDEGNFSIPDSLPDMKIKDDNFMVIEYITTVFFTVELILRLSCCSNIKAYIMSWINSLDMLSLVAGYLLIILNNATDSHQFYIFKEIVLHFQTLRVLRLVRYCQHFSTIQVLKFSLIQNYRDILVLILFVGIGVLFFANILFLVEDDDIMTIPKAWWLGVITMTTVGYGDVIPSTPTGNVICGLCAIGGLIIISSILPIFVDSFLALYGVAQLNRISIEQSVIKPCPEEKTKEEAGHTDTQIQFVNGWNKS